jgi:hypothetical protein
MSKTTLKRKNYRQQVEHIICFDQSRYNQRLDKIIKNILSALSPSGKS